MVESMFLHLFIGFLLGTFFGLFLMTAHEIYPFAGSWPFAEGQVFGPEKPKEKEIDTSATEIEW